MPSSIPIPWLGLVHLLSGTFTALWNWFMDRCLLAAAEGGGETSHIGICPICNAVQGTSFLVPLPRAGSGVVRIDPLRFRAGCRTKRRNQV